MPPQTQFPEDVLAIRLIAIAQYLLVAVFGLLPVFFVPSAIVPSGYSKILFVVVGVLLALILYGFALLRSGVIRLQLSLVPVGLWAVACAALVSALLSSDFRDAVIGETFEVHTTLFVVLLALTAPAWMILGSNKNAIMRFFMVLAGSTLALSLFHIVRLVLGADFFSLGLFAGGPTLSPFGSWNDLAIFFGLAVMLSLVALEQLRLTSLGQALFGLVVAVALVMLAVINFFAVWIVLGLISLVALIYELTKDRFSNRLSTETKPALAVVSICVSLAVLVVSTVFILGGGIVGNAIARLADISYLEVRPSFSATTDIVKNVYESRPFIGIGPNHFSDAWRRFKGPSINSSVFWNTDFVAGFGYIPTFFATTGLVGGIAWVAFFLLFVWTGVRMLLRTTTNDRLWYFIGTTSFLGGLYIWSMTIVYVPGPVLLLLAALCTGLMSAAYGSLMNGKVYTVSIYGNRRAGFLLIMAFLILFIGSVGSLYFVGRHYAGVYAFNASLPLVAEGASLDEVEAKVLQAYAYSRDDSYARKIAEYQIVRMQRLLGVAEPTEEQRQQFTTALTNAINAAQLAITGDNTDPNNAYTLGSVYAALVPAQIEGAYERSIEHLTKAQELDPRNPLRLLTLGQVAFAAGRQEEARAYIERAIALKSNYSDALFFLAQMDIAAGDTESAIARTTAITVLEAQNPVRFFQLGVLLFSTGRHAEAATAFERAITLDRDYANARFYLALTYDMLHKTAPAREQLTAILALNPGHQLVENLLGRLDRGEPLVETAVAQQSIAEHSGVEEAGGSVTASSAPDTPLVSPVNTPPTEDTEEPVE